MGQAGSGLIVVCDVPLMRAALVAVGNRKSGAVKAYASVDGSVSGWETDSVVLATTAVLGSRFAAVLAQLCPRVLAVVVVDGANDAGEAHRFLDAGATSYLSRAAEEDDVLLALDSVRCGEHYLEEGLRHAVFARMLRGPAAVSPLLTARELEVAWLLADGATTNGIADQLFVSPTTAKTHLSRIYGKLGVHSRAAAVRQLSRLGILDDGVLQTEDAACHPSGG